MNMKVNVRCKLAEPNDAEDKGIEGVYVVEVFVHMADLSKAMEASTVLDIFHCTIAIAMLDDFEICVLDASDALVVEDPHHIQRLHAEDGGVIKISDVPRLLSELDGNLSADELDHKYSTYGNSEHSEYTRANWRNAVAQQQSIVGYWDWVKYRLTIPFCLTH